jgi:hypothetical membrane protein
MAVPDIRSSRSPFIGFAALCGILAFLLAVAGSLAIGFTIPGYDPIRSTISELGERGSPAFAIAGILFILIGICAAFFSAGLLSRSRKNKLALAGSVSLFANAVFDYIGSGIFPCDAGGAYVSISGQIHFIVSVIGMSVMVLPAFFYARVFKREGRALEGAVSLVAAIAIVVAAVLFNIAFFTERNVGLFQRILDFTYFGWMLFISAAMLAPARERSPKA